MLYVSNHLLVCLDSGIACFGDEYPGYLGATSFQKLDTIGYHRHHHHAAYNSQRHLVHRDESAESPYDMHPTSSLNINTSQIHNTLRRLSPGLWTSSRLREVEDEITPTRTLYQHPLRQLNTLKHLPKHETRALMAQSTRIIQQPTFKKPSSRLNISIWT